MKNDVKPLMPLDELGEVVKKLAAVPKAEVDQLESQRPKKRYRKPKK